MALVRVQDKRGRPAKPDKAIRQFNVRLREEDYARLQAAAKPYPLSTWVRAQLLRLVREMEEEG